MMQRIKKWIMKLKDGILRFGKILFLICVSVIFYIFFMNFYQPATFYFKGNVLFLLLYIFILCCFMLTYGCFKIGEASIQDLLFSFCLATLITNIVGFLTICLFARALLKIYPLLIAYILQITFAVPAYWGLHYEFRKLHPLKHAIGIISNSDYEMGIINKYYKNNAHLAIDELVPEPQKIEEIYDVLDRYSAIVIGHIQLPLRDAIFLYAFQRNKKVIVLPSPHDILFNSAKPFIFEDSLIYNFRDHVFSADQLMIKRITDVIISVFLIVISFPIWLIAMIGIKCTDGGPIFFKQTRLTRNGQCFNLIKFRSMIVNAEASGISIPATDKDPRITPIGRVIRKIRFDEFPQLINIIKGEMSIVGPRPERVEHVQEYTEKIPEFTYRNKVKAGLTGYAQIYGKYNTTAYDKLKLDLMYIEHYSIRLDLLLIIMTIKVLLRNYLIILEI